MISRENIKKCSRKQPTLQPSPKFLVLPTAPKPIFLRGLDLPNKIHYLYSIFKLSGKHNILFCHPFKVIHHNKIPIKSANNTIIFCILTVIIFNKCLKLVDKLTMKSASNRNIFWYFNRNYLNKCLKIEDKLTMKSASNRNICCILTEIISTNSLKWTNLQ